jgi:hypothetical protein
MRTLFLLIVLFTVHRLLLQVYLPYRERVRSLDQKMNWITIILLTYLVFNFIYVIFFR